MTATIQIQATRTWTAVIEIGSEQFIAANAERYGTLRDVSREAEREAAGYLREGLGTEARIHMYKMTKTRGTEYDRQSSYLWAEGGVVYRDRDRSC